MTAPSVVRPSVVRQCLGTRFADLHPKVQWRFGFSSSDEICQLGTGVMDEISLSSLLAAPIRRLGARRGILPPAAGQEVPFTVANYAYRDDRGREVLLFTRRFHFPGRVGVIDSLMIADDGTAFDVLGRHADVSVHTECSVGEDGALCMAGTDPRVHAGPLRSALPAFAGAVTDARESWDAGEERHRIEVSVRNPVAGALIGYRGWFTAVEQPCTRAQIPAGLIPRTTPTR